MIIARKLSEAIPLSEADKWTISEQSQGVHVQFLNPKHFSEQTQGVHVQFLNPKNFYK
jgi:hypothetical protein